MTRELLKSMLSNMINDKLEEATLDLHSYLTAKMRELAGLSGEQVTEEQLTEEQVNEIIESASDEEFIEALKNVYGLTEEQVDEVVRQVAVHRVQAQVEHERAAAVLRAIERAIGQAGAFAMLGADQLRGRVREVGVDHHHVGGERLP